MAPDPLDVLRLRPARVEPRPEFAAELRARVQDALHETPDPSSDITDTRSLPVTVSQTTPIPTVTAVLAHLVVDDGLAAIDFYVRAFGAVEQFRLTEPSGKLGHAELTLGGTTIMLADEYPEYGALSPRTVGGSPITMYLQVNDADAFVQGAVEAGAVVVRPVQDQSHGERSGQIEDPFGHHWNVSHTIENVAPEEMQRRWDAER